jgi:hypothetical protein
MTNRSPLLTARRLLRRAEQNLCLQCGRAITTEDHHVSGRNNDPELTAPLCQACHAQATELLRSADVDMRKSSSSVERVRRSLRATALFLGALADAMWRWADLLDRPSKQQRGNSPHNPSRDGTPGKGNNNE